MGREDRYTLDNGLEVRWWQTEDPIISANLIIRAGAIDERPGEEGLAHFLEHCVGLGGAPGFTPEQDLEIITSGLGHGNWTTSALVTIAEGSFLPGRLPLFISYAAAHALTPSFDTRTVERERQAVLREIADRRSSASYERNGQVRDAIYRGHPVSRETLGDERVVARASVDDLRALHARGYHPANMTLLVAGPRPDNVTALIEDAFGAAPAGEPRPVPEIPILTPIEQARTLRFPKKNNGHESPSADLSMYIVTPPDGSPDAVAAHMIAYLLNGHGRLPSALRHETGIAYNVHANQNGALNAGVLSISSSVDARRVDESLVRFVLECNRLQEEPVTQAEFERVRYLANYGVASAFMTPTGKLQEMLYELIRGVPTSVFYERLHALTPRHIMEAAQAYLPRNLDERHVTGIASPLHVT